MAGAPYAPPTDPNGRPATTTPRARELFLQMGTGSYYERARAAGMTLTAWLEAQDPSGPYKDGLDAFERQLRVANIRTQSDEHTYFADDMDAFSRDQNTKKLFPEWARRQWNGARHKPQTRAPAYSAADYAENTAIRPYVDDLMLRYTQLQPAVPLAELIATTTPIRGNAYRSTRLTDVTAQKRTVRIAEGAPISRVKLSTSENTIRFGKFGRAIETTYEEVRRLRIDVMALHIQLMSIQAEVDEVAAVIDTVVNGDGNSGTAATSYNLTTLDSTAVAGTLSLRGWLAFKQKFPNPYALTTVLVQDAVEIQLRLLNVGSANIPLIAITSQAAFGGFTPINDRLAEGVRVGVTADAPALKIVGIDRRFAVERVTEIGSEIQEMDRFIENQTNLMTFSINEGFARWQVGSGTAAVLDINA
jgi:hypothetical protein